MLQLNNDDVIVRYDDKIELSFAASTCKAKPRIAFPGEHSIPSGL